MDRLLEERRKKVSQQEEVLVRLNASFHTLDPVLSICLFYLFVCLFVFYLNNFASRLFKYRSIKKICVGRFCQKVSYKLWAIVVSRLTSILFELDTYFRNLLLYLCKCVYFGRNTEFSNSML